MRKIHIITNEDGWCLVKCKREICYPAGGAGYQVKTEFRNMTFREEELEELRQQLNKWHFEKNEKEKTEEI